MSIKQQNQIEEAIALISSGAESLVSCAHRYGRDWAKIRGQVQVNLLLQEVASRHKTTARATFNQEAIRTRLQNQIQQVNMENLLEVTALSQPPAADSGNPPVAKPKNNYFRNFFGSASFKYKFATAMVAVLFFLSLSTWAVEASGPGDLLYGPKLELEKSGELFSFSPENKAEAHLNYAQSRLDEIQQEVQQGRGKNLDQTVSSYEAAIKDAVAGSSPQRQELIKEKLQKHLAALENLKQSHPNIRQPQLENLIMRLHYLLDRLNGVSNPRLPPPQIPPPASQTAPTHTALPGNTPAPSPGKPHNETGKTTPPRTANPGGTTPPAKTPTTRPEPVRVPRLVDLNTEQTPHTEQTGK